MSLPTAGLLYGMAVLLAAAWASLWAYLQPVGMHNSALISHGLYEDVEHMHTSSE